MGHATAIELARGRTARCHDWSGILMRDAGKLGGQCGRLGLQPGTAAPRGEPYACTGVAGVLFFFTLALSLLDNSLTMDDREVGRFWKGGHGTSFHVRGGQAAATVGCFGRRYGRRGRVPAGHRYLLPSSGNLAPGPKQIRHGVGDAGAGKTLDAPPSNGT